VKEELAVETRIGEYRKSLMEQKARLEKIAFPGAASLVQAEIRGLDSALQTFDVWFAEWLEQEVAA
jgi:hypothetical protein